jgi:hypothetical protein
MGIDAATAQFLLGAKRIGVSFARTATIGKQTFFATAPGLHRLVRAFELPQSAESIKACCARSGDSFLALLGAESVTSIDISDYQGATVLHDLNQPIGEGLKEKFSVVLDGGSLEHIFDVRQAIKNCLEMVAPGGHFIGTTVGNNLLGHGFYQFSPEFFFRVLSPENGFRARCVMLCKPELDPPEFYAVEDPVTVRARVELINDCPVYLMVVAQRVESRPVFATVPQQSDAVAAWNGAAVNVTGAYLTDNRRPALIRRCAQLLPVGVKRSIRKVLRIPYPNPKGFDQPCFHRVHLEDMAAGQIEGANGSVLRNCTNGSANA